MITEKIKKLKLINEFYFFRIIFQISSYFMYSFYLILLYKQTNDFKVLILDSIIFYAGGWIGFIFGSVALQRVGYVNTFRLSFIFTAIAGIAILVSIPQIALLFPLLSLLRGFGRGIFWPVYHTYTLKEFNVGERGNIISIVTSTNLLLDIAFPVLVGTLISYSGDYVLIYIIGSAILLTSVLVKFGYNKMPSTKITSQEISNILKDKVFVKFAILTIFDQIAWIVVAFTILILPFIFTKNEGDAGAIMSIVNLIAAIIAFTQRKAIVRKSIGLSKFGYIFGLLSAIVLIYFWNVIGLTISMILMILCVSLRDPLEEKLVVYIKQIILDKLKNQSAIEMNMIMESIYLIGRTIGLIIFLLSFIFINNSDNVFKIFILISSLWGFINIYFLLRITRKHKKELVEMTISSNDNSILR
ncbi:MAG: MFS transporter [Candidatus Dojkabacteria bacterium]